MNKKLKEMHIVFENCEELILKPINIKYFSFDNVYKQYSYSGVNNFNEHNFASESKLMLNIYEGMKTEFYGEGGDAIARLTKHDDIAQIHLYFDDESHEWFFVNWDNNNEWFNNYQKTELIEKDDDDNLYGGNIIITIKQGANPIKD